MLSTSHGIIFPDIGVVQSKHFIYWQCVDIAPSSMRFTRVRRRKCFSTEICCAASESRCALSPRHAFCTCGLRSSGFLLCTLAHQKAVGLTHRTVAATSDYIGHEGMLCGCSSYRGCLLSVYSPFFLPSVFLIDLTTKTKSLSWFLLYRSLCLIFPLVCLTFNMLIHTRPHTPLSGLRFYIIPWGRLCACACVCTVSSLLSGRSTVKVDKSLPG